MVIIRLLMLRVNAEGHDGGQTAPLPALLAYRRVLLLTTGVAEGASFARRKLLVCVTVRRGLTLAAEQQSIIVAGCRSLDEDILVSEGLPSAAKQQNISPRAVDR